MTLPVSRSVSEADFDAQFRDEANIAEFSSKDEEVAYEKRVSFLTYLIKQRASDHFGPESESWYVLDDWWPDHTRHIDLALSICTRPFLAALHGLLADEFAEWRIQICVYNDILEGTTSRGSMVIYADRIVIDTGLCDAIAAL